MAQPIAPDYGQQFLFPHALEDWVPADAPVRFLREFVDQLNLAGLGFAMPISGDGRPAYAPSLLLKIWLFGYFYGIRSTRKLEGACRQHVSLMWLTGLIAPDHNTLWRFWQDNKKALRDVFKESVSLALNTGAVGLALQAIDGTKIEAAASRHSGWTKEHMEKVKAALDAALEQTEVKIVQENGQAPQPGPELPASLAQRQALREQIQKGLAQLASDKRAHHHPVEPEARRMKLGNGTNRFGYNAQIVADQKEGIIVACEATRQETDNGQLLPMLKQAQENLGRAALAADSLTLADGGYGAGADLLAAEEAGKPVLAPPAEGSGKDHPYATRRFVYEAATHSVTCPQNQKLDYEGHTLKQDVRVERFRCHCKDCPVRALCSKDPKGRQIEVWPHTSVVQAMRQRLKEPQPAALYAKRAQIIERRFAQLKQHDNFRRWTVWGLENVRVQWALLCTTLNLRVLYKRWQKGGGDRPKLAAQAAIKLRLGRIGRNFAALLTYGCQFWNRCLSSGRQFWLGRLRSVFFVPAQNF